MSGTVSGHSPRLPVSTLLLDSKTIWHWPTELVLKQLAAKS